MISTVRLQKFLAEAGIASRRKSEELMLPGRVMLNGKRADRLGTLVDPAKDKVQVDGKVVVGKPKVIYAFYKPVGVTSTVADAHAAKTITDFFPEKRVYPVGRLDKISEGLMVVTNDGELANTLAHPRFEHEKEYEVLIEGTTDNISKFGGRFVIDGYRLQPMKVSHVRLISKGKWRLNLTLTEGRKRQIREAARKLGYTVIKLKRVRMGKLRLATLKPGEWRVVSRADIL